MTATTDGADLRVVADGLGCVTAPALLGEHVFWSTFTLDGRGLVERAPKGGGPVEVLAVGLPSSLVSVDPTGVTWSELRTPSGGVIRRVDHDGGGAAVVVPLDQAATALATDATTVYWGEGGVVRALVRGRDAGATLGTGDAQAYSMIVDGDAVVWLGEGSSGPSNASAAIKRVRAGGAVEVLVGGLTRATGLVAQGGDLYFVSVRDGAPWLQRVPRDGGAVVVVAELPTDATSFAVDERAYYFAVSPDAILRLAR